MHHYERALKPIIQTSCCFFLCWRTNPALAVREWVQEREGSFANLVSAQHPQGQGRNWSLLHHSQYNLTQCQSRKVTYSFQSPSSLTPPLLPVNKYPVTEMSKQDCRSQHQLRLPKRLSSAASSCCPRTLPRCSAQCGATYPTRQAARSTSIKLWFCLQLSVWFLGT